MPARYSKRVSTVITTSYKEESRTSSTSLSFTPSSFHRHAHLSAFTSTPLSLEFENGSPHWISGSEAVFKTPKSPSPAKTRRRTTMIRLHDAPVPKNTVTSIKESFKVPASNIKSPLGVKTRARRSSVYVSAKGKGKTSSAVKQVASKQEKTTSVKRAGKSAGTQQKSTKLSAEKVLLSESFANVHSGSPLKKKASAVKKISSVKSKSKSPKGKASVVQKVEKKTRSSAGSPIKEKEVVASTEIRSSTSIKGSGKRKQSKSPSPKKAPEMATPSQSTPSVKSKGSRKSDIRGTTKRGQSTQKRTRRTRANNNNSSANEDFESGSPELTSLSTEKRKKQTRSVRKLSGKSRSLNATPKMSAKKSARKLTETLLQITPVQSAKKKSLKKVLDYAGNGNEDTTDISVHKSPSVRKSASKRTRHESLTIDISTSESPNKSVSSTKAVRSRSSKSRKSVSPVKSRNSRLRKSPSPSKKQNKSKSPNSAKKTRRSVIDATFDSSLQIPSDDEQSMSTPLKKTSGTSQSKTKSTGSVKKRLRGSVVSASVDKVSTTAKLTPQKKSPKKSSPKRPQRYSTAQTEQVDEITKSKTEGKSRKRSHSTVKNKLEDVSPSKKQKKTPRVSPRNARRFSPAKNTPRKQPQRRSVGQVTQDSTISSVQMDQRSVKTPKSSVKKPKTSSSSSKKTPRKKSQRRSISHLTQDTIVSSVHTEQSSHKKTPKQSLAVKKQKAKMSPRKKTPKRQQQRRSTDRVTQDSVDSSVDARQTSEVISPPKQSPSVKKQTTKPSPAKKTPKISPRKARKSLASAVKITPKTQQQRRSSGRVTQDTAKVSVSIDQSSIKQKTQSSPAKKSPVRQQQRRSISLMTLGTVDLSDRIDQETKVISSRRPLKQSPSVQRQKVQLTPAKKTPTRQEQRRSTGRVTHSTVTSSVQMGQTSREITPRKSPKPSSSAKILQIKLSQVSESPSKSLPVKQAKTSPSRQGRAAIVDKESMEIEKVINAMFNKSEKETHVKQVKKTPSPARSNVKMTKKSPSPPRRVKTASPARTSIYGRNTLEKSRIEDPPSSNRLRLEVEKSPYSAHAFSRMTQSRRGGISYDSGPLIRSYREETALSSRKHATELTTVAGLELSTTHKSRVGYEPSPLTKRHGEESYSALSLGGRSSTTASKFSVRQSAGIAYEQGSMEVPLGVTSCTGAPFASSEPGPSGIQASRVTEYHMARSTIGTSTGGNFDTSKEFPSVETSFEEEWDEVEGEPAETSSNEANTTVSQSSQSQRCAIL